MIDPLYLFVFWGLFTPGPNVIMLTASGARFGFWRSLPHLLGVAAGVGVIAGLTGFGLGTLLKAQPGLTFALKCIAAAWILWLAWQLWNAGRHKAAEATDRPFRFHEAVLFQWVNPKVWSVALAASAGFALGLSPRDEAIRLALAFSSINLVVCLFWTSAGHLLGRLLSSAQAWRTFLSVMAIGLAASAILVFAA